LKRETNKNHPSIEVFINLNNIFEITLDELLKSDDELKEKVLKNSKQQIGW